MYLSQRHLIALKCANNASWHFTNISSFHPHGKFVFLEDHFGCTLELGLEEAGVAAAFPGWLLIDVCLLPWKMRGCLCTGSKMVRNRQLGLPDFFCSTELTFVVIVFLFCRSSEGERVRACTKGSVDPCLQGGRDVWELFLRVPQILLLLSVCTKTSASALL